MNGMKIRMGMMIQMLKLNEYISIVCNQNLCSINNQSENHSGRESRISFLNNNRG